MNRREFLSFSLAAGTAQASPPNVHLSLLPLYTAKDKLLSRELIASVATALERTYKVAVTIRPAECYYGVWEGNAVLDFLSGREGLIMAAASAPLRGPVRSGVRSDVIDISGWADIPNDSRERPRGSVITSFAFATLNESERTVRLGVVGIHELGHNLGAWDCREGGCYMNEKIDLGRVLIPRAFCARHREILWPYLR